MTMRENRIWEELEPGQSAEIRRICTADDLFAYANISGNRNPMHLPGYDLDHDGTKDQVVAPSIWLGSLVSAVLGNTLPGPGTLYLSQNFRFLGRARAGDTLIARVTVSSKREGGIVAFDTSVTREADGEQLVAGAAEVIAPPVKLHFEERELPGILLETHRQFDRLLDEAAGLPALSVAVVAPEEENSLGGALLAMREGIIQPILIGDRARIEAVAAEEGYSLAGIEIEDVPDHAAAANRAVDFIVDGRAQALMKGHLHTDDLLRAAMRKERGLRIGRRFTHIFVMDVPGLSHLLLVSDAAINISPDLATKVDIVQNAIDLCISLGVSEPKVAVLSAVETVNDAIPSSVDAALLSKMAERGQIRGGAVDGPLAMDNAVDEGAAKTKGIRSSVAGHADVLVVPNLDAGNMVAKQLVYLAHAEAAGIVMGARVPIILTSRADNEKARLVSCAVAAIHHFRGQGAAKAAQ